MRLNKIFFIFLFVSLLSCRHNLVQPKDFTIVSPVVGNVYYDDIPTICAIDKNITSISWSSSLDGNLGTGAQISCRLSAGTHIITARDVQRDISVSVSITVTERNNIEKNGTRFLLPYLPYTCVIKNNQYKPYIVSLDGSASDVTCITELLPKKRYSNNVDNNITAKANGLNNNEDDLSDVENELKLFRCTDSCDMQKLQIVSPPRIFKRNTVSPLQDENERSFLIVNTAFQSGQPHNILFKRYYTSDTITVWLPKEYAADTAAIDACIAEFENTIYIRVTEIWGTAADIDYNQKFTIVFSPTINDEKRALGDLRQRCPTTGFLPYKQDPLTGEAVEFLPCMGKINGVVDRHGNELIIGLPHPLLNRNGTIARLLPYSFVFYRTEDFYFDEVPFGNPTNCTFTGTELLGRVFFCITKK